MYLKTRFSNEINNKSVDLQQIYSLLSGYGTALSRGYIPLPSSIKQPILESVPKDCFLQDDQVECPQPIGLGRRGTSLSSDIPRGFLQYANHEAFKKQNIPAGTTTWQPATDAQLLFESKTQSVVSNNASTLSFHCYHRIIL